MGPLSRMLSRPHQQVGERQGRLYFRQKPFRLDQKLFLSTHPSTNGCLCIPRESSTSQFCEPLAPLSGNCSGLSAVRPGGVRKLVCQPPLVHHRKVPVPFEALSPGPSFDGSPLLGFCHMVAPINKNEGPRDSLPEDHPLFGYVHQLSGGVDATPQVGPVLHDLLRKILEGKQIQNSAITDFLARNPSLKRYSSAFQLLWTILVKEGVDPPRHPSIRLLGVLCNFFSFPRPRQEMHTAPCSSFLGLMA